MASIAPFKHSELATMAGTAARPNEDYAATGPDWAIVLDGATHFDDVDTGCIHDVPWLVSRLAAALVERLIISGKNLPETLASAIEATCAAHADSCDLANPDSPSSTVAMVRARETSIEYLVLGDSPVIFQTGNNITVVADDRVDRLQVSYLSYPEFDRDPHPALATVVVSRLSRLDVTYRDFRDSANPPILHRKETFVGRDYPGRGKFARLTEQEERHGLLADPAAIGTRDGWHNRLQDAGWTLRGHRLVRSCLV